MTLKDSDFGPRAIIDSNALKHNLRIVRERAPNSKVLAVVKANAYGHGIVPTARALSGADAFGVARLNEALALRTAGLAHPIVLLEGVFTRDELDAAAAHRLEIVLHSFDQLELLDAWRGSRPMRVWLKIDTGMNRLGFRVDDFDQALQRLRTCKALRDPPRLMTHLACAEEIQNARTSTQIKKFRDLVDAYALERSIANSAGLFAWPDARVEWVRPGLMLYGLSPFANQTGVELGLQAAMSLTT
ncbi:MAG TPA: alanine racemase, partial [Steroidobacteraceae bacterium]|nr:alanine racemase [Steroidobacteraceae bacterium]